MNVPIDKLVVIKRKVEQLVESGGSSDFIFYYTLMASTERQTSLLGGDEYVFVPQNQAGLALAAFITEGLRTDCTPLGDQLKFDDSIVDLAKTYPLPVSLQVCETGCQ